MSRFYSQQTGCTYIEGLHKNIPGDAKALTEARYLEVIANPAPGKIRSHNAEGLPILVDPPEVDVLAACRVKIAATRFIHETAGIIVNGSVIDTTRDSQALITAAALSALLDPGYRCEWKTANGFVSLNASDLTLIAQSVRQHVQACFDREAQLLAALDDTTYIDAMLEEGWPT